MTKEKAAIFIDNSNVYKGMQAFGNELYKRGEIKPGEYLRMKWDRVIEMLEKQNGGLDIFSRHFFASLPPAANVTYMKNRPSEEEWGKLVKMSAQTGFYKVIQDPPFNFTLHAVPLKFAMVNCRNKIKQAYYRCRDAQGGQIKCSLKLSTDECYKCENKFLFKYEKGVDVALSAHMILFVTKSNINLNRVILVAGDGDFKESARYVRQEVGKDLQIVSWRKALSRDLEKVGNKETVILDDHWKELCEIRSKPPLKKHQYLMKKPKRSEVNRNIIIDSSSLSLSTLKGLNEQKVQAQTPPSSSPQQASRRSSSALKNLRASLRTLPCRAYSQTEPLPGNHTHPKPCSGC